MIRSTLLRFALCCAAAVSLVQPATASNLVTRTGGTFSVRAVVVPDAGRQGSGFQSSALLQTDLAWTVVEPSGAEHQGVFGVAGGVREDLPVLIQNPVDGEVHLIFAAMHESTRDLFLRTWLGQSWSEPIWLAGTRDGDDRLPRVVFTSTGEVVLAWLQEREDGAHHVLFQYGVMDSTGMRVRHAHVDMGRAEIYTLPTDGDVRLSEGVAHLATDGTGDQAVLVLADPDTNDVGLLRLDLRALRQIGGGGGFAPVPVNFMQIAMGNGPGSLSDRIAAAGELLPTWRVEMLGGEGYYWFDDETMSGLAFRDGQGRGLVTLSLPEEEIQAHSMMIGFLRASMGRLQITLEPLLAREEANRNRRVR